MIGPEVIRARFASLSPHLDERARRLLVASEALAAGYGGIAAVSRATGIAASTIGRGLRELASAARLEADRVRRPGGGRKSLVVTDAALVDDLLAPVSPSGRGDATRCRRCAGPARACAAWRRNWRSAAIGSATR